MFEELLARLEAASEGSRELDRLIHNARGDRPPISAEELAEDDGLESFIPPYTTSLDAALTLVPEEYDWDIAHIRENGRPSAWLQWRASEAERVEWAKILPAGCPPGLMLTEPAKGMTPPLALCIASLKARRASEAEAGR